MKEHDAYSAPTLSEGLRDVGKSMDLLLHYPMRPLDTHKIHTLEDRFARHGNLEADITKRLDRIRRYRDRYDTDFAEAGMLQIQHRALNYLYGAQEHTPDEFLGANPLRDILALVVSPGVSTPGISYQLAIAGPPVKNMILEINDASQKPNQFAYEDSRLRERSTFRTLARFADKQRTVTKGLYIVAQVTDRYPELLRQTLDEYVRDFTDQKGNTTGMAVGLLELLHNLNILSDRRFRQFGENLRDMVMDDAETYEHLRNEYFYRIVAEEAFWLEGERVHERKKTALHQTIDKQVKKTATGESLIFPAMRDWDESVKNRAADIKTLRKLTFHRSLTHTITTSKATLDEFTANVRETLRKKSELALSLRLRNKHMPLNLEKTWQPWLDAFTPSRKLDADDDATMEEVIREITEFFAHDPALSMKTKSLARSATHAYTLDAAHVAKDKLFQWVFSLSDAQKMDSLSRAAGEYPAEFALLLRLMVHKIASTQYRHLESDFLMDPLYKTKADAHALEELVGKLRDIINKRQPQIKDLVRKTLSRGIHQPLKDLTAKKHMKKIERKLRDIQYNKPVPLVTIDKSYSVSRRTFLQLMLLTGLAAGTAVFLHGLSPGGNDGYVPGPEKDESPENFRKNIDQLLRRSLELLPPVDRERIDPFFYGSILHLPQRFFKGRRGETVGYFPVSRVDENDYLHINKLLRDFNFIAVVKDLDGIELPEFTDELVIRIADVPRVVYPPLGWEPSLIVQEEGAKPTIGSLGEIYYAPDGNGNPPKNAIFVYKRIEASEFTQLSRRVVYAPGQHVYPPNYFFSELRASIVTEALSKDPALQVLHREFIDEMAQTDRNDVEAISQIAIRFTLRYEEYTMKNRFYALDFQVPGDGPEYASLAAIAAHPDAGYYCQVAAEAYRQFMQSAGFTVLDQPGYTLYNHDSQLWGRVSHRNSVVLLPNKHVLYVDMTPPRTAQTPQEDADAVAPQAPSSWETAMHKDFQTIARTAVVTGLKTTFIAGVLYGGYQMAGTIKHGIALRHVKKTLSALQPFSHMEKEVVAAAMNHLAYLPYDTNFYDRAADTLILLNNYSHEDHKAGINWLLDTHPALLHTEDALAAFEELKEHYHERPQELVHIFPQLQGKKGASMRMPESFLTVFEVARLVNLSRFTAFKHDIYQRLHVENGAADAYRQAAFKAQDILEMLRERIYDDAFKRDHLIRAENTPYLMALHTALASFADGKSENGNA